MVKKFYIVVAVGLSALSLGCEPQTTWDDPGPRASFEAYLFDLFRGDAEAAFQRIAPEDRKVLVKAREGLKGMSEADTPKDHEMLVIAGFDNPYDIKKMALETPLESAPAAGQSVVINLTYRDGRTGKATMKWSGEQWFVDLPLKGGARSDG